MIMKPQIWNKSGWSRLFDNLQDRFTFLLKDAGFDIICITKHDFDPCGTTLLWLLAESHFAVHTWPEEGVFYWELSSCNQDYFNSFEDPEPFLCEASSD